MTDWSSTIRHVIQDDGTHPVNSANPGWSTRAMAMTTGAIYDVYQASSPGAEDFSAPTYTSRPGATSFVTPPLAADKPVYFVVRARDKAGNEDSNTVERQGQNVCV